MICSHLLSSHSTFLAGLFTIGLIMPELNETIFSMVPVCYEVFSFVQRFGMANAIHKPDFDE
jgi:hypothetical protein